MNKMQSLSYSNLESHRGGKDRSKSNSKQRDNERGAIKEHLGEVGQAGVGQFQVGAIRKAPWRKWQFNWWSLKMSRLESR